MIKIRLKRIGKKHQPHFRVVVANARGKRDGKVIETIGSYEPRVKNPAIKINQEKLDYWLSRGAQPTATVRQWFKKQK